MVLLPFSGSWLFVPGDEPTFHNNVMREKWDMHMQKALTGNGCAWMCI